MFKIVRNLVHSATDTRKKSTLDSRMQFSPSLSRASVKSISSNYTVEELQEKIGELRKQHTQNVGEFLKVTTLQKERMIQGLEEKLAARRDKRERKIEQFPPVSI